MRCTFGSLLAQGRTWSHEPDHIGTVFEPDRTCIPRITHAHEETFGLVHETIYQGVWPLKR